MYARPQRSEQEARGKERVNPLTTILGIADLGSVYEQVFPARIKWNNIGFALGLDSDTLSGIRYQCRGETDEALREMLVKWLQAGVEVTWEKICVSLCSPVVGWDVLAEEIRDYVLKQGMLLITAY